MNHSLSPLKKKMEQMSTLVEEMLETAMKALLDHDSKAGRQAIEKDKVVNRFEKETDDLCLRLLSDPAPDPKELRFIITAIKINKDMERIGDLIVNLAERALELNEQPQLKPYVELPKMAATVQKMIHENSKAFLQQIPSRARQTYETYKGIAKLRREIFYELLDFMIKDPTTVARSVRLISIGRYLERIGDHAANSAELIVALFENRIIRT
ncbi:MAG: phosphate signaling complex protein PhoU [Deltaproteobacteria bacterium]|nr:phosphate signaling complex protein PhoU [Deltaproteobacteria bacterium]